MMKFVIAILCNVLAASMWVSPAMAQEEDADPPEVAIGERLFFETRFAEFFARHAGGDANAVLQEADPAMDTTETPGDPLPGPFAGQSMNCRQCHLVDEQLDTPGGGMRTYTDFARRTPIPAREDGLLTTPRNSPPLVNASLPRAGGLQLHLDGEFGNDAGDVETMSDLVRATLTGRNYGWLADESANAIAQVAKVIREDDGSGELAQEFGGAYLKILTGTDPSIPAEFQLPEEFRVDVASATDRELLDAVASLIGVYSLQLIFEQGDDGAFVGSPFDAFLAANGLPQQPDADETPDDYTDRLRSALTALGNPVFVADGDFEFHDQERAFGPDELRGFEIFLAEPDGSASGIGNCATCHTPPSFTDSSFRNTGVTQVEYDGIFGDGRFARLQVPSLGKRLRHPNRYLPATARHPRAKEPFRRPASANNRLYTDLGVWNIFANPDFPNPQAKLYRQLCQLEFERHGPRRNPFAQILFLLKRCNPHSLLGASVAVFKTPHLRDLSHSAPYMHNGAFDDLEAVLRFYQVAAGLERAHRLHNGDPEIGEIRLSAEDIDNLVLFLRALNEDYS